MRIAVTYQDGQVYQHFGHTQEFKIYDVEDNQVISSKVIGTDGHGHGALAGFLKNLDVDIIICGGIGGGAQNALKQIGIQLYGGVQGDVDEVVECLLDGRLIYNDNVQCSHHESHHKCGDHGCGEHHCH